MRDMFDIFDRMFGVMDSNFREIERDFHCPNRLPVITIPAVKTSAVDQRAYHDGEKIQKFTNGILHCDSEAAVIYDDDRDDEFWLNGRQVDKAAIEKHYNELLDNKIHSVWIDGKEFKVTGKKLRQLDLQKQLTE